jgi:hypothetical protein
MFEDLSALQNYPDRSSKEIYERGTLRLTARQITAEKQRLQKRILREMVSNLLRTLSYYTFDYTACFYILKRDFLNLRAQVHLDSVRVHCIRIRCNAILIKLFYSISLSLSCRRTAYFLYVMR